MSFYQKINDDLKQAMKDKKELELSVLRMLAAALKNKKIALGGGADANELTDEQGVEIVSSEIKKRKDSIVAFEQGGRQELANKEKQEIVILEKYLPAQLSDEEIENVVREVVSTMGEVAPSDFGKVMGQSMGKLKGKADGNKVTAIVKRILAS